MKNLVLDNDCFVTMRLEKEIQKIPVHYYREHNQDVVKSEAYGLYGYGTTLVEALLNFEDELMYAKERLHKGEINSSNTDLRTLALYYRTF